MTSIECQTEYSLIPIESVDINYCVENSLCPACDNISQLVINDIEMSGSTVINISIPEELERDYNYDVETNNLEIEIIGYWYDQEKMQQMVNTQYYQPTAEDMNNLIWKIAEFIPLLAIMLLFVRTWYIIKKWIFKS